MNDFETIYLALQRQCPQTVIHWRKQSLVSIESSAKPSANHQIASSMTRRKSGDSPFTVKLTQMVNGPIEFRHWTTSDATRILLNLALINVTISSLPTLLTKLYEYGDERERAALLMGLIILDPKGLWVIKAEDCCRTNSLLLLTAIAMKNPYAAAHFSSRAFNQLVLKSLFLGLDITHIYGLEARRNKELSTMCADYIKERVAANRNDPRSIWMAIRLSDCCSQTHERLAEQLSTSDEQNRYYAAIALKQQTELPQLLKDCVQQQLNVETDNKVFTVLTQLTTSKDLTDEIL